MLSYNPELATAIANAMASEYTKTRWANTIISGLGATRRLKCTKNGTAFINVAMVGAMTTSGGDIINFGKAGNASAQLAADLMNGTCLLILEGGGNQVQGSLGLTAKAQIAYHKAAGKTQSEAEALVVQYDFMLSANPTATTGIGMVASARINANRLWPSGTGPEAPNPADDPDFPAFISYEDNSNPAAPFIVGTIPMNVFGGNMVYEHHEVAQNIGDVRVTYSDQSIVVGTGGDAFELGALVLSMNKALNEENPNKPVHQVMPAINPYGRWSGYPTKEGYDPATDNTYMAPFKVIEHRADMSIIRRIEMDGSVAINSPTLAQSWGPGFPTPFRPHITCATQLFSQSHLIKDSTFAEKYVPGMTYISPYSGRNGASTNAPMPLVSQLQQHNSSLSLYAAPWKAIQYEQSDNQALLNYLDDGDKKDPYLFDPATYNAGPRSRIVGLFGGEPGAKAGQESVYAPGGSRNDRHPVPSQAVLYLTDKNGVRPKGEYPYKLIKHHYGLGYFNHNRNWVRNVKRHTTLDVDKVLSGLLSQMNGYYHARGKMDFVPGGAATHVDVFSISPSGWPAFDKNGRPQWAGDADDNLHCYPAPGLWTFLFNSPGHTILQKHMLITTFLSQTGAGSNANARSYYMIRGHAWRLLQYIVSWMCGTTHELGVSQALIEKHLQIELEAQYRDIYATTVLNNEQSPYCNSLRNLGIPAEPIEAPVGYASGKFTVSGTTLKIIDWDYGSFTPGQEVTGSGLLPGTRIEEVLTGSTFRLNKSQTTTTSKFAVLGGPINGAGTASISGTTLTVSAVSSGQFIPGQTISGAGISPNTRITAVLTGSEGVGTYTVNNAQNVTSRAITAARTDYYWQSVHDYKSFYLGMVYVLYRQSGLMAVMNAKSPMCATMNAYTLANLDKYGIDYFMDTKGVFDGAGQVSKKFFTAAEVVGATSWVDYNATIVRPDGPNQDWVTNADGTRGPEFDISSHLRTQYVYLRKSHFNDFPHPRLDACVSLVDSWYAKVDAQLATVTTPLEKRSVEFTYRMPTHFRLNNPTVLAPV